jgi:hypothetical protein
MALQLTENYKGIDVTYWKILTSDQNCLSKKTRVTLGAYSDGTVREEDVRNFLKKEIQIVDGIDLTRDDMYLKLKESKIRTEVDPETGDETEVETNKFVNATDC